MAAAYRHRSLSVRLQGSATVKGLQQPFGKLDHDDLDDALTCALLAYLFDTHPDKLISPGASVPASEGWIWVPRDGVIKDNETIGATQ